MILEYYKTNENAYEPIRANPSDAGLDVFFSPGNGKPQIIFLEPGTCTLLGTGLKFGIPHGYMLEVKNRSSWASKRSLLVGACVIDAGYDGEVMINFHNVGNTTQEIRSGDKIAQLVMLPVVHFRPAEVGSDDLYYEDLCVSNRGSGGSGS